MESDQRPKSRFIVWLHRIGYFTTAVVAIEAGLLVSVVGNEWLRHREMIGELVEESRTHETPLQENGDSIVRDAAVELLAELTPLVMLHGDGLRFVAMPSFGTSDYALAISLAPQSATADGLLMVFDESGQNPQVRERRFTVPAVEYRKLVADLDQHVDGWPGDAAQCLDGSPAAFERVRGSSISSGIGNCSPHYDRVKLIVLNAVRRFAPGPDLPTENDWHRYGPEN